MRTTQKEIISISGGSAIIYLSLSQLSPGKYPKEREQSSQTEYNNANQVHPVVRPGARKWAWPLFFLGH
jgi:hypothetical protein